MSGPFHAVQDSASDFSVTTQVTNITEGVPATDLVKVLLRHIAIDLSNFIRDVQSSSQVYFRSRMIYNTILYFIKQTESSSAAEWATFEQYTVAVPSLERILLNFYLNYTDDKKRDHVPPTDSVESVVLFIEIWGGDREMLSETFKDLSSDEFTVLSRDLKELLTASAHEPRKMDDINTIKALSSYFSANQLTDHHIAQQRNGNLLTSVRTGLNTLAEKLANRLIPEEITTIAIKSMMIAYIPFALISEEATSTEWKDYLKSNMVWQAIDGLILRVISELQSSDAQTIAGLNEKWLEVRDLLLNLRVTEVDTAEDILCLLKLVANIRRPFHGRCVELVRTLFHLDVISKGNGELLAPGLTYRKDIKRVMSAAIDALETVKEAVSDVKAITLTETAYRKQDSNLQTILVMVQELFSNIGLSKEWESRLSKYNDAVKVDETHLVRMRERLSLTSHHNDINMGKGIEEDDSSDEDTDFDDDEDEDVEDEVVEEVYSDGKILQIVEYKERPISKRQVETLVLHVLRRSGVLV